MVNSSLHNQSTEFPRLHFESSHKEREKEILLRRSKQNFKFGNIIILGCDNMKQ